MFKLADQLMSGEKTLEQLKSEHDVAPKQMFYVDLVSKIIETQNVRGNKDIKNNSLYSSSSQELYPGTHAEEQETESMNILIDYMSQQVLYHVSQENAKQTLFKRRSLQARDNVPLMNLSGLQWDSIDQTGRSAIGNNKFTWYDVADLIREYPEMNYQDLQEELRIDDWSTPSLNYEMQ